MYKLLLVLCIFKCLNAILKDQNCQTGNILFAYFFNTEEKLHYAISDDGFHWNSLNNNDYIYESPIPNTSIRDPYVSRKRKTDE